MFRRRTWHRLRSASQIATAWMLLVAYAAAAFGVPLPTIVVSGESPFPCQAGRCGCRTAEQCWKSCCCHTPRERLAWAESHGVTPPSYVIVAARCETASRSPRACCAHKPAASKPQLATKAEALPHGIVWISALDAARCRGEAPVWNNVPISLPASFFSSDPAFEPRVRPLATIASAEPLCPWFTPPDPPPWIS